MTANIIFQDILKLTVSWRHIYSFPVNGQSTHTNARNARKNKKLFNYRNAQFFKLFGRTRKFRQLMGLVVKCEYTNRLWYRLWRNEWRQANLFYGTIHKRNSNCVLFDLRNLARGEVNGFFRVGAAAKLGKAKQIKNRGTIGVPLFFAKNLIWGRVERSFPHRLTMFSEVRRRKKQRRKKKLKKKIKKKKKKKLTL